LESDKDWRNVVGIWDYVGYKIPIYMHAISEYPCCVPLHCTTAVT